MKFNICDSCNKSSLTFVLDCGFKVCLDHFEGANNSKSYSCHFCQKKHFLNDETKKVANKIAIEENELEKTITEIGKRIDEFNYIKQHKDYFRGQYYQNIICDIEKKRKQILNSFEINLNAYHNRVLNTLEQINFQNEQKIKKNITFNQLDEINKRCDQIMDTKEKTISSEKLKYLEESRKTVDSFFDDLESLKVELEKIKTLEFIEEKQVPSFDINGCFGIFKYEDKIIEETGDQVDSNKSKPKENKIAEPQSNKQIEFNNLTEKSSFDGRCGRIRHIGELSNGDLVTGSTDGLIKIWNSNDASCKKSLPTMGRIKCFKVLPNDTIAVCLDFKKDDSKINIYLNELDTKYSLIKIYDPVTGSCEKSIQLPSTISSIELLDNETFITGHDNGSIYFCNKQTGHCLPKMEHSHSRVVFSLIKLNDNNFVSCSADYEIKLWDINEKKCIKTYSGHSDHVICLVKLNDYQFLSGSKDGSVKLWNIREPASHKTIECMQYGNKLLNIHLIDADRFICFFENGSLVLASIEKGKIGELKTNKSDWSNCLKQFQTAYLSSSNQLITSYDTSIKIYSLE